SHPEPIGMAAIKDQVRRQDDRWQRGWNQACTPPPRVAAGLGIVRTGADPPPSEAGGVKLAGIPVPGHVQQALGAADGGVPTPAAQFVANIGIKTEAGGGVAK